VAHETILIGFGLCIDPWSLLISYGCDKFVLVPLKYIVPSASAFDNKPNYKHDCNQPEESSDSTSNYRSQIGFIIVRVTTLLIIGLKRRQWRRRY